MICIPCRIAADSGEDEHPLCDARTRNAPTACDCQHMKEIAWFEMHDHADGYGNHTHHRKNGGHGSHDGVRLGRRLEILPTS